MNEARFELFLHTNTTGPTATISGNTVPSDLELFGTIKPGLDKARLTTFLGLPALLINGCREIPVLYDVLHPNGNPNNPANDGIEPSEHIADGIYFHAGSWGRMTRWTRDENPISEGCQTAAYGDSKSHRVYRAFMRNFPRGWEGRYYLTRSK